MVLPLGRKQNKISVLTEKRPLTLTFLRIIAKGREFRKCRVGNTDEKDAKSSGG